MAIEQNQFIHEKDIITIVSGTTMPTIHYTTVDQLVFLPLMNCMYNHVVIPADLPYFQLSRIRRCFEKYNPIQSVDSKKQILMLEKNGTGEWSSLQSFLEKQENFNPSILVLCDEGSPSELAEQIASFCFGEKTAKRWSFIPNGLIGGGTDWKVYKDDAGKSLMSADHFDLIVSEFCDVEAGDGRSVFTESSVRQLVELLHPSGFLAFPYHRKSPHLFNVVNKSGKNISFPPRLALFQECFAISDAQDVFPVFIPVCFVSQYVFSFFDKSNF